MSLPIPFIKFIPKIFKEDSKAINLANKVDIDLTAWQTDIMNMKRFLRPEQISSIFLEELNFLLEANFNQFDSDVVKRKKIQSAVTNHKLRGTWSEDVKIRIDDITGISPGARILRWDQFGTDDWILVSDGTEPASFYWSALGADGIDDDLGIYLIGEGTEVVIPGNIYIDCHEGINVSTLTADEINQIVVELQDDVAPAYMILYLGYVDAVGVFQQYAGGIID